MRIQQIGWAQSLGPKGRARGVAHGIQILTHDSNLLISDDYPFLISPNDNDPFNPEISGKFGGGLARD